MNPARPLFIPLKREYFDAFSKGEKSIEWRIYGPRWTERTCWPGRLVTLSLGYGKRHRLSGTVVEAAIINSLPADHAFFKVYDAKANGKRPFGIKIALNLS
jgi:hypothetical protein